MGKSSILFSVATLFQKAYDSVFKQSSDKPISNIGSGEEYSVKYILDSKEVVISLIDSKFLMLVDGQEKILSEKYLPAKVLAFAHLPTDRYPFRRRKAEDKYVYLGLRQTTNMTSTSALVSKIIRSIWLSAEDEDSRFMISKILDKVELGSKVTARFKIRDKALLGSHHIDDFSATLTHTARRSLANRDFEVSSNNVREVDNALSFIHFAEAASARSVMTGTNGELSFDILRYSNKTLLSGMEFLRELKIIGSPDLVFHRLTDGKEISFSNLSSGDQQILGTQLRLISEIEPNSLVLIDEPEVSLHPKRQQSYIPQLYELTPYIDSCSVVMATHSHLMTANLPDLSSVVCPNKSSTTKRRFSAILLDPHGLPSEQVLYSVFGIDSASSLYALRDVKRVIDISRLQRAGNALTAAETEEIIIIRRRLLGSSSARSPIVKEVAPLIEDLLKDT